MSFRLQDTMEPNMQAIPLATSIDPVQFRTIKRVYEVLVSAEWFNDTEENRRYLSDLVMRQYRKGRNDEADLFVACESIARERYSRR
jgi:hypothetical protein